MPANAQRYSKPLTREKIANAAIDIVRSEGSQALSMRKVAGLFAVDVAALYRHYENKEALLAEIGQIVSDEIDLELSKKGSWDKRMYALAQDIRHRVVSHPELGIHGQTSSRTTPFFARANGLIATLLFERGLRGKKLLFSTQTILHLVTSIAESEAMAQSDSQQSNHQFASTIVDYLPKDVRSNWPAVTAKQKWSIDFDSFFDYALAATLRAITDETG